MSLIAQAASASQMPTGVVAGVVGALTSGGVVAAAFRWLAGRDDRREEDRSTERREFLQALAAQQAGCREELKEIVAVHREERSLDRETRRQIAERNASALTEVKHALVRLEARSGPGSSGSHPAVGGGL